MAEAVYCVSSNEPTANTILTHLRTAEFSSEISVLLESDANTRNISLKENAVRGAKLGGAVGALLALIIPGIGPVLVLGPLAAIFGGAAAGGVVGGLAGGSGAFAPLGLPNEVTERLKQRLSAGDILIAVHSNDPGRLNRAIEIFKAEGSEFTFETHHKDV